MRSTNPTSASDLLNPFLGSEPTPCANPSTPPNSASASRAVATLDNNQLKEMMMIKKQMVMEMRVVMQSDDRWVHTQLVSVRSPLYI